MQSPTDLKFIKEGHFTSSPYCVTLQAREVVRGRTVNEDAKVCIFTNLTSVTKGVEFLPFPESLRASESGNRKSKKITNNPATGGDQKVSSGIEFVVNFPDAVEVLQNASEYARVAEPTAAVVDSKTR